MINVINPIDYKIKKYKQHYTYVNLLYIEMLCQSFHLYNAIVLLVMLRIAITNGSFGRLDFFYYFDYRLLHDTLLMQLNATNYRFSLKTKIRLEL